uniref:WW domain-containing protein n=1 Tax=Elaeophora elaphi TaxID=1147741 RepID=A0A0R3RXS3_9BILA
MGKKKKEIHMPGLPAPWKAYYSEKRGRIFYFNTQTKQPSWEIPVTEKPLIQSDISAKQLGTEQQQKIAGVLEKKYVISQKSLGPSRIDGRRISDKHDCLHSLDIPITSETSEELMEIDEISVKEINCHEEPMEIDVVVEEVQAFRREHFLHPNLFAEANAPFFHANTKACETVENAGMMLVVFDTSCLLQDTALLPMCIQGMHSSLIPYTVLQELDGLKKAKSDELRSKAVKTIAYMHDSIKRGCSYLFIENTFEALNGMEEFGCRNNDDIILKCAFITTKKNENEPVRVVFATNDKNLAVKAAAHNIITADRNDLLHLLTTGSSRGKSQQLMTRSTQKIPNFSFALDDKPSSSVVETVQIAAFKEVVDHLPGPRQCHSSSPSFTFFPQKTGISSYNSSVSLTVGGDKNKFPRNFIRSKKGSCGASSSVEHHEVHQQRRIPYSIRKTGKEGNESRRRLSKKRKLCQLSGHSMADFLEIFDELVEYLKYRNDKKSVEDMRRISKVIDSIIANESSSLSVLVDMVSKFYDFYADRDVFVSAIHFDKRQLMNEYENAASTIKEKLLTFQKQLI